MNFQANDKVVCINDDFEFSIFGVPRMRFHAPEGTPRKGGVYCVRAVRPGEAGTQSVYLVGLSTYLDGYETGFNSTRFRKVAEAGGHTCSADRRTDDEILRDSLGNPATS